MAAQPSFMHTYKNNKKVKTFLDEKIKTKQRLQNLWGFIEAATEAETEALIIAHEATIFTIVCECWNAQVEKIQATKEKVLYSSKEVADLVKCLNILDKMCEYPPEWMKRGWHRRNISAMLQTLLGFQTHHRLRIQAFNLLLKWTNVHMIEDEDWTALYRNVVPWAVFQDETIESSEASAQLKILIDGQNRLEWTSITTVPSYSHVSLEEAGNFLVEILQNIHDLVLEPSSTTPAKFQWQMFKKYYLQILYGRPTICPPSIQDIMVDLLMTVPSAIKAEEPNNGSTSSLLSAPRLGILADGLAAFRIILKDDPESAEIIHSIIREALSLNWMHSLTISKALHGISEWVRGHASDQALFAVSTPRDAAHTRIVIQYLSLVFMPKMEYQLHGSEQFEVYREALCIIIGIATSADLASDLETWSELIRNVLQIMRNALLDSSNMPAERAAEFSGYLAETILAVVIKSDTDDVNLWNAFGQVYEAASRRWTPVVQVWSNYVRTLTTQLAFFGYGQKIAIQPIPVSEVSYLSLWDIHYFSTLEDIENMTAEQIAYRLQNIVCVIGNPNKLLNQPFQAEAIKALVDMYDTLSPLNIRQTESDRLPAFLSSWVWLFAPTIFQAAQLQQEPRLEGASLAVGCVCRMMIRRKEWEAECEDDMGRWDENYPHFYRIMLKALSSGETSLYHAAISNSKGIFSADLPGVHVIIPAFISCIKATLKIKSSSYTSTRDLSVSLAKCPEHVEHAAIDVLASLIGISTWFIRSKVAITTYQSLVRREKGSLGISRSRHPSRSQDQVMESLSQFRQPLHDRLSTETASAEEISIAEVEHVSFAEVHKDILEILLYLLQTHADSDKIRKDLIMRVLRVYTCLGVEELFSSSPPNADIINMCIYTILTYMSIPDLDILNTAADCFASWIGSIRCMGDLDNEIKMFDSDALYNVMERISHAASEHLSRATEPSVRDISVRALARLLLCCMDLVMAVPPGNIWDNPKTSRMLFNIIERTLVVSMQFDEKRDEDTEPTMNAAGTAAVTLLHHILHHSHNFPTSFGAAHIHSTIQEEVLNEGVEDHDDFVILNHNDSVLLTVMETRNVDSGDVGCRFILRDMTGKYSWESRRTAIPKTTIASLKEHCKTTPEESSTMDTHREQSDIITIAKVPSVASSRVFGEMPLWEEHSIRNPDMLGEALQYIGETHEDCLLYPGHSLITPPPESEERSTCSAQKAKAIQIQVEFESASAKLSITRSPEQDHTAHQFTPQVCPNATGKPQPGYLDECRLLLSHFGILNYEAFVESNSIKLLHKSPALYRDLRALDRKQGRETIKFGLFYVGKGQTTEQAILNNSKGSPEFEDFVRSIGWLVDLETHQGFTGGMERNGTNGRTAVYYATSTLELIFHDVTKMPTDPSDIKQLKKKRHIGNDHVHIIWNEHYKDYCPSTIGGDFGNAKIIIRPLSSDLFTIDVLIDPKFQNVGPMVSHLSVTKDALPVLLRATAIHAHRLVARDSQALYSNPTYTARSHDISTIVERYAPTKGARDGKMEFEKLLSTLLRCSPVT